MEEKRSENSSEERVTKERQRAFVAAEEKQRRVSAAVEVPQRRSSVVEVLQKRSSVVEMLQRAVAVDARRRQRKRVFADATLPAFVDERRKRESHRALEEETSLT